MRLCLSCRYLADGDAAFCPHCAKSFGGRRCPRGHLSPPDAICCQMCGRADLSEATRSVGLGFLIPLALLLVGGGISAALSVWVIAPAAKEAGQRLWPQVVVFLRGAVNLSLVITVLLYLIPGQFGRDLRRGVARALSSSWRTVWRTACGLLALRTLARLLRDLMHLLRRRDARRY